MKLSIRAVREAPFCVRNDRHVYACGAANDAWVWWFSFSVWCSSFPAVFLSLFGVFYCRLGVFLSLVFFLPWVDVFCSVLALASFLSALTTPQV